MPLPLPEPDAPWALFLDFDGTLVEIAPTPDAVHVADYLPPLLQRLRDDLNGALAVVSGRPIAQIDGFLGGPICAAAGLHGLERRRPDGSMQRSVPSGDLGRLRERLLPFAAAHRGVLVEDKILSLALHYRLAPEYEAACRAEMAAAMARLRDLELLDGKMVLEARPRGMDKGRAIAAFSEEQPFRGRVPVFVGDDRTDEDGFAQVVERGGRAIKVGQGPSRAQTFAEGVPQIHEWLRAVANEIGRQIRS